VNPDDFARSVPVREMTPVTPNVTLWWCDLDVGASNIELTEAVLAPAEHARAARFGNETLRRRWIAGRGALRVVLGRVLDLPPARVEIQRGARGRPELAHSAIATDFNVSHTGGAAVIGVAHGVRIGIDVERSDRTVGADRLARKFLAPGERNTFEGLADDERRARFLKYWTCKEAMSKATGDGLIAPFARLHVDIAPPRLLDGPPPYTPAAWTLFSAAAPAPYLVTLALWRRRDGA
jgi:4'-phosphopantetheinyl transferase